MSRLRALLEMIRFSHTLFALPFALLSAVMAWGTPWPGQLQRTPPRAQDLAGILLCMVFARSAAMAFNRLVDRHIDALNPRTAGRHLPSGRLTVSGVALFTLLSALGFCASCALFLPNVWPLRLAVPVLLFLLGYSFAKRFTVWAHYWLGAALMLAPICVWIAIRGAAWSAYPFDILPAVALGGAVLLWVGGFDVIYACQDVDFDRDQRLHSIPAHWGVRRALQWAALSHAMMLVVLALLPWCFPQLGLGAVYLVGLAGISSLIVYEHSLVRPDDLSRVNLAFFHVNAVISASLLVLGAVDVFWI